MHSILFPAIGVPGFFELLIIAVMLVPILIALVALVAVSNKKRHPPRTGNLTPCPDCEQLVSIRAQTCPHCGAPLKPSL
jgi:hypothetical protein